MPPDMNVNTVPDMKEILAAHRVTVNYRKKQRLTYWLVFT